MHAAEGPGEGPEACTRWSHGGVLQGPPFTLHADTPASGAAGGACTGGVRAQGSQADMAPEAPQGAEEEGKQVSWWVEGGGGRWRERRAEEEGSGREVEGPFW